VADELVPHFPDNEKLLYKKVKVFDSEESHLIVEFEECIKFIDLAIAIQPSTGERGKCLVHCVAGVSRSATVVLAYLMQKKEISRDVALELLVQIRPVASPNEGFLEQLKLFENMSCTFGGNTEYHQHYRSLVAISDRERKKRKRNI